jgi:hypothetical protein
MTALRIADSAGLDNEASRGNGGHSLAEQMVASIVHQIVGSARAAIRRETADA